VRFPLAIALGLSACAPQTATFVPGGESTDEQGLYYTADWDGITAFSADACESCHGPGGTAEFMPLPLVLQADLTMGSGLFVVPLDPAASRLWRVVSGELAEDDFAVMPQENGPLEHAYIDHVRLWIEAGAPFPPLPLDLDGDGIFDDTDCDDSDPEVHPGAAEICDGKDNDCNGDADGADADEAKTWFPDGDADSFGSDAGTVIQCDDPGGHVQVGGDCDDADARFNPAAIEDDCADPNDYNCDGATGLTDGDGDGFGACEECNDNDPLSYPGAPETCDGQDNDCDGLWDEDVPGAPTWYPDADGDGYGDVNGAPFVHCTGASGWVASNDDCADTDPAIHPGVALDIADGLDNDCDGLVDEDGNAISHATDIQPLWDAQCTSCHGGFVPQDGLDMEGNGFDDIVGVAASDVPGMSRIEPGDPANSYLWHKLEGTHQSVGGAGSEMPKGRFDLTQPERDLIESWILGGALP